MSEINTSTTPNGLPRRRVVQPQAPVEAQATASAEDVAQEGASEEQEVRLEEGAEQAEPVQDAAAVQAVQLNAPKRRGRPPKNPELAPVAGEPKKRGRKPGVKNKVPAKVSGVATKHDLQVLGGVFVNASKEGLTVSQYIDKHRQEIAAYDAVAPKA